MKALNCRKAGLLETWSRHAWRDGVQLDALQDLTSLVVRTENSTYEVTIICARTGEVVVRGGRYFPEFVSARIAGSSLRGSFLKVGGVYAGFSLEIQTQSRVIITSRIQYVSVTPLPG